jgi:hypothetical protein
MCFAAAVDFALMLTVFSLLLWSLWPSLARNAFLSVDQPQTLWDQMQEEQAAASKNVETVSMTQPLLSHTEDELVYAYDDSP